MTDAPDFIYLQWIPGYPRVDADDEVTWCMDQINDDDIKYAREDFDEAQNAQLRAALQEAVDLVYSAYSDANKGLADMDTKKWRELIAATKPAGMTAGEQHLVVKEARENMGKQDNG